MTRWATDDGNTSFRQRIANEQSLQSLLCRHVPTTAPYPLGESFRPTQQGHMHREGGTTKRRLVRRKSNSQRATYGRVVVSRSNSFLHQKWFRGYELPHGGFDYFISKKEHNRMAIVLGGQNQQSFTLPLENTPLQAPTALTPPTTTATNIVRIFSQELQSPCLGNNRKLK